MPEDKLECGHGQFDTRFDCVPCLQFTVNALNALVSKSVAATSVLEARVEELQEALRNLLRELDSKGPAYDPSMRKLAIDQARAALSAKEK